VTNMPICAELNADIKHVNMTNMPICAVPNADIKRVNMTTPVSQLILFKTKYG
jgi:hypothetical protein